MITVKTNSFKTILNKFILFYNENLKKKHIVIFIISLIFFVFIMSACIASMDSINAMLSELNIKTEPVNILKTIFSEKIPLVFLIIFSGITPFLFIPLIGVVGFPYVITLSILSVKGISIVFATICAIFQIFGVSLAIATGIYYCKLSTNKFRYSQMSTFGLDDIKQNIYETRNNQEKLIQLKEKRKLKFDKKQKLNVKTPYFMILISFVISVIIVSVFALISGV